MHDKFAPLLTQALSEPGIVSAAYGRFHRFSIGNQILAAIQLQERDLPMAPIASFLRWKEPVSYTHLDVYKRQVDTDGGSRWTELSAEKAASLRGTSFRQSHRDGQGDRKRGQCTGRQACLLYTSRCV